MEKRRKNKNEYFTSDTERYIVEYNNTDDPEYRSKLFTDHIYYPFYKLVENIIHNFKFYYTDTENIEDLKHDLIHLLLTEKIHRFDPSNGAKAYSYFGTIIKRELIVYNKKNLKKLKTHTTLDHTDQFLDKSKEPGENTYELTLSDFFEKYVEYCYKSIEEFFPRESDRKVADAVLTLFKTRKNIQIFRKKILYLQIREITDCDTNTLTRVVNLLKEKFENLYREYSENYNIVPE